MTRIFYLKAIDNGINVNCYYYLTTKGFYDTNYRIWPPSCYNSCRARCLTFWPTRSKAQKIAIAFFVAVVIAGVSAALARLL